MNYLAEPQFSKMKKFVEDYNMVALFDELFDSYDLGTHKVSDRRFKHYIGERIYTQFTMVLSKIKLGFELFDIDFDVTVISKFMKFKCFACGHYIKMKIDPKNPRRLIVDEDYDEECFKLGVYKYEFTPKTNKMIFANNIMDHLKHCESKFGEHSLNETIGIHKTTEEWIKNDVVIGYVGNCTARFYQDQDKLHIVNVDVFEWLCPEYNDYTEDELEYIEEQIKPLGLSDDVEEIGRISCSLWWIMGTDKENVNFETFKDEYLEIDVEPNKTYILEVVHDTESDEMVIRHKFYKAN